MILKKDSTKKRIIISSSDWYFKAALKFWQFLLLTIFLDLIFTINHDFSYYFSKFIPINKLFLVQVTIFFTFLSLLLNVVFKKFLDNDIISLKNLFIVPKIRINPFLICTLLIFLSLVGSIFYLQIKNFLIFKLTIPLLASFLGSLVLFLTILKSVTKISSSSKNVPRNLFLKIHSYQRVKFILICLSSVFARVVIVNITILLSLNLIQELDFLVYLLLGITIFLSCNPKIDDFLMPCAQCRNLKSKSLRKFSMCTSCYKRKFYY